MVVPLSQHGAPSPSSLSSSSGLNLAVQERRSLDSVTWRPNHVLGRADLGAGEAAMSQDRSNGSDARSGER